MLKVPWRNWKDIRHSSVEDIKVFMHKVVMRPVASRHEVTLVTPRFDGSKKEKNIDGVKLIRTDNGYAVY